MERSATERFFALNFLKYAAVQKTAALYFCTPDSGLLQ